MVFNATFNNISVVSLVPVLLVEETGVTRENHRPAAIKNVDIKFSANVQNRNIGKPNNVLINCIIQC